MIAQMQELIEQYWNWLRDKTALREVGDWVEITTPYLDRHNDCLQIYAKRHDGGLRLTDDGRTVGELEMSGCKLESPKRRELLTMTLNGFGVQMEGDELTVNASAETFALRKHSLVQAILAVNDLFYLAEPMVKTLFLEDVTAWLDLAEIRYVPKVKFTGKTGYDHVFDFAIPKSRAQPERIIKAVNRPSRDAAQSLVLAWLDTREVRPPDSRSYALLNDADGAVPASVLDALRNYDLRTVLWSEREQARAELAA